MINKIQLPMPKILGIISIATIIFLISSVIRHLLFQSNALDLGWFDQAVYLISQGKNPIISFQRCPPHFTLEAQIKLIISMIISR